MRRGSLRNGGTERDEAACAYAAEDGQLEVLKWLRAEGCPCYEPDVSDVSDDSDESGEWDE